MKLQLIACYVTLMALVASLTVACIQKAWSVAIAILFIILLESFLTRKIYKLTND